MELSPEAADALTRMRAQSGEATWLFPGRDSRCRTGTQQSIRPKLSPPERQGSLRRVREAHHVDQQLNA